MGPALSAAAYELVAVGEVVVAFDLRGDVVARVERRTVQSFDQPDLILVDHRRVEEAYEEETGLRVAAAARHVLSEYAVRAGRERFDLRAFLPAACDELLGVLKVSMAFDGLAVEATGVELIALTLRLEGFDDSPVRAVLRSRDH